MTNSKKLLLVGAALTGMTLIGCSSSQASNTTSTTAASDKVMCYGVNSCKGHGQCGGKVDACSGKNGCESKLSCAGKNSCKGKGLVKLGKKECLKKGGKVAM